MTNLTLVRHGETDWNRARRIQGSTDIPLNDTGRIQARAAAHDLAERVTRANTTVVVSSDLSRAHETARIIAAELGLAEPTTHIGLRERSYGEAEGVTDTEFAERWGPWDTAVVPGAESRDALATRALAALHEVVEDAQRASDPHTPDLIVVAHGALIRAVMEHVTDGVHPGRGRKILNGSAHSFRVEPEGLTLLETSAVPV
ncbi:histidine phosphatase family protein [Microbacterium sp. NPDC079995]|uniref:histidine phosphatase family protein n=1 Tax=unclassified Microbacterium TaxID=2609290 RepID=UPI00344D9FD3